MSQQTGNPLTRAYSVSRRDLAGLGAVAAGGWAASAWLRGQPQAQRLTLTPVVEAVLSDPGSPTVGSVKPSVTIVLFTDYQCPICRQIDPALQDLIDTDPEVRVVFKDWPIFGEASALAATVALAAGAQGKYRTVHQALMASKTALDADRIERVVRQAGVNWTALVATRQAKASALKVQLGKHAMQAFTLGLQGTPAYIVGAQLISGGLNPRQLAEAVRKARHEGAPAKP